jgi:putative PIN family toxin of toxin-antitoxin system
LKIVLDTNVLVSGILSPNGPPAAVLRALLTERVTLCFDERIVSEYRDVLTRTKFSFDPDQVEEPIGFLEAAGSPTLAAPLAVTLPDPWDQMFIEIAVSSNADFLVTGNLKHFPETARAGVRVVSPRAFLDLLLEGQ